MSETRACGRHAIRVMGALVWVMGCAPTDPTPTDDELAASSGYRAHRVRSERYAAEHRSWTVDLVRIERPDGGRTYVQWISAPWLWARPAVMVPLPYSGIDWTGEEVDARWRTYEPQPSGLYLDVDGPRFDGDEQILHWRTSPRDADEYLLAHLRHEVSVLGVYTRFYAGGDLRDDIADMRAATWFLSQQWVDHERIGLYGESLGGFLVLQAAIGQSPRPRAVVAEYPTIDYPSWVGHGLSRTGVARAFLGAYLNRAVAAAGGLPDDPGADYGGLRVDDLCGWLPADTLLLHDDLDNLSPIDQSERLIAACGGDAVYWRRDRKANPAAPSHGPLTFEATPQSKETYAMAYLHLRLAAPAQPVALRYRADMLGEHLATVHAAQRRGVDVSFAAPRLRELCDWRLWLTDTPSGDVLPGAAAVARAVNAEWGTAHSAFTIAAALERGLPPP